jgi:hemin uptake protein HemP
MQPEPSEARTEIRQVQPPSSIRAPVDPGQWALPSGIIPADLLFQGAQEILIRHKGDLYHLRITRNDKLILTK